MAAGTRVMGIRLTAADWTCACCFVAAHRQRAVCVSTLISVSRTRFQRAQALRLSLACTGLAAPAR